MNYESMLNRSKGLSNLPRFEYFCTRYIYIYIKDKRLYCKVPSKISPNSRGCFKGLIIETISRHFIRSIYQGHYVHSVQSLLAAGLVQNLAYSVRYHGQDLAYFEVPVRISESKSYRFLSRKRAYLSKLPNIWVSFMTRPAYIKGMLYIVRSQCS
jgi:hypothetical protein